MALPVRNKDPQDVLDYGWDWAAPPPDGPWLTGGDTISASTWAVSGPDSALTTSNPQFTTTTTTVWLTGGTLGVEYTVTNHVTTTQGRQRDRSFIIHVINR